ncbi:type VI immunity family protein [Pseudomonas trivialis]|uniref:type VI immunity family protein n=1 Tax=Pseudomonas trivialis TaxID=200450 RepID=UPI0030D1DCF8
MNEEQFFKDFNAHCWDFTIVDEEDEEQPVLQVGLVATFYLVDAYLPVRRKHIAEAFELYCKHFGEQLVWGYMGSEKIITQDFCPQTMNLCLSYIQSDGLADSASFMWSSQQGFQHSGKYMFEAILPVEWFERIHNSLTTIRFYLPVEELKGSGRIHFEKLILDMCKILRPLHGTAGLGIQNSYEIQNYQHIEYELLEQYRGIDLTLLIASETWRTGYSNLNWYTYLAHHWVSKLGKTEDLLEQLNDVRIGILPYEWGTIFRAGDWPALGKANVDPRPELYVMVNEVLKPLRVSNIGSLHYGSIAGEVRLNERTSNQWLRRFDLPKDTPKQQPSPLYRRNQQQSNNS